MKIITRDSDYAMRALCYLAKEKGRIVSASELMCRLGVPRQFLRKLLQVLNKKGILRSFKGIGGGFECARIPSEIYLMDVMEIFQGPFCLNECFLKKMRCPHTKKCILRRKIERIEKYVARELSSITIASLLR